MLDKEAILLGLQKRLEEQTRRECRVGQGWTQEQVERQILEDREMTGKIAEEAEPKFQGLSKISKMLRKYDEGLSKLVWKIPFTSNSVTKQDIEALTKNLKDALKNVYNRAEIESLLKPLVSRNPEIMQKELEKERQEKLVEKRRADAERQARLAAEQRMEELKRQHKELMSKIAEMQKQQQTAVEPLSSSSSPSSSSHDTQMDVEKGNQKPSKTSSTPSFDGKRKASGEAEGEERKKAKTPSPGKSNSTR